MLSDKYILEQADILLVTNSLQAADNGWYKRQPDGSLLKLKIDGLKLEPDTQTLGDEVQRLFIILEKLSPDDQVKVIKALCYLLECDSILGA